MRVAEVIGRLSLSRTVAPLVGKRYVLAIPLTLPMLAGRVETSGEELISLDELGCSEGDRVALSEGGEACVPFLPVKVPIDAYVSALLDDVRLRGEEVDRFLGPVQPPAKNNTGSA